MKKSADKMFVIRKYIMARSAEEALVKERTTKADDVYVDDDWRKNNRDSLASAIGFKVSHEEEKGKD